MIVTEIHHRKPKILSGAPRFWATLFALLAALVISSLIIMFQGTSPLTIIRDLIPCFFQGKYLFGEIFVYASIFLLIGLGIGLGLKANYWNIGAEGQLWWGGLFGALAGIHITFLPPVLHVLVVFIAAFLGGALWGVIPGILKLKYGVSEILSNLMLNPIAIFLMEFLLWGPMKDPAREHPMSVPIQTSAQLPLLFPATRVHLGVLLAFLAPLVVYFLLSKTTFGYKLRAVGDNQQAARVAGIKNNSILMRTILISSGLSGLAGALLVCGVQSKFIEGLSPGGGFSGYGFIGIGVAMLGCCHPFGIVLSSILFGFLNVCGHLIHVQQGISQYLTDIISGLIILFVLYSNYFIWKWKKND